MKENLGLHRSRAREDRCSAVDVTFEYFGASGNMETLNVWPKFVENVEHDWDWWQSEVWDWDDTSNNSDVEATEA